MTSIDDKIESLVREATVVFNREGDLHSPRPIGIKLLGDRYIPEIVKRFAKDEILGYVPIVIGDRNLCSCKYEWYKIETKKFFK